MRETMHHECTVTPGNFRFEAPEDVSLLQAARNAGIDLPASCRNGTCRACMCSLKSGHIGYTIAWPGLTAEEKQEGWILPRVAVARSDVVIDVPRAKPLGKA